MKTREMNKLNMKQLTKALLLAGLMTGLTACGGGGSSSGAGGSDTHPSTLGDTPAAPADSTAPAAPASPADPADPAAPAAPAPGVGVPVPGAVLGPIVDPLDLDPLDPHLHLIDRNQTITAHTKDKHNRTEQWTYHINRILGTVTINTPDGDTFSGRVALDNSYTASGHSHWHHVLASCSGEIQVQGHLDNATGIIGQYNDQGSCHVGPFRTHYNYTHNITKD